MPYSAHKAPPRQSCETAIRLLATLPLAWLAATLSTAGLTSVLVAGGLPRAETTVWLMLTGLLLWLALAIYAVAARWLLRAWLVPTVLATLGALLIWQFDAGGAL